ncbi:MAG TPA: LysM peptidoglycan-binding domain-containing protein [Anaerolineae bacterium]|nr:LysM peptidoglycan-binding domain-containing protein [Anaerolineae bacterium]
MTLTKTRVSGLMGLALAAFLIAGCERAAAVDPLATTGAQNAQVTATPRDFPTPTGIPVAGSTSPIPSPTQIPAVTNTPAPVTLPPAQTPTATLPPATQQPGGTYTVQTGDRLFSIGRRFGVNPYSIAQANNIPPPYIIYPGQVLRIPSGGGTTPPPSGRTHVVQRGENLFRISLRYGTTVPALAAANNISNVNLIFVGQVLRLP